MNKIMYSKFLMCSEDRVVICICLVDFRFLQRLREIAEEDMNLNELAIGLNCITLRNYTKSFHYFAWPESEVSCCST